MVSMASGVLLQKGVRINGASYMNESRSDKDSSGGITWIFGGLLAFTVVVSLLVWLMRNKPDDEERDRRVNYEPRTSPQDEREADNELYGDEAFYEMNRPEVSRDSQNERRIAPYEGDVYSTDVDYRRPATTESIFTFNDHHHLSHSLRGLRHSAIGYPSDVHAGRSEWGSKFPGLDCYYKDRLRIDCSSCDDDGDDSTSRRNGSYYLPVTSRCQVAPERID